MSHSINHQFIHLVWPTKNLCPLISEDSQASLMAYLTGTLKGLGGFQLSIAGTSNHVHLLANTPLDLSVAELLRQIKSSSSKWYRAKDGHQSAFGWNEGYSAFTVSPASIGHVKQYLAAEEHRHRKHSFEDELTEFLKIQELEFNPKFLTTTTYSKLIYHLVWSVKNREPLLNIDLQAPLHQRIQQEMIENGGKLYAIGNVADHIHLLVECTSKISTACLVQKLKTATTHLIKSQDRKFDSFCWQEGYGVFSVGKPAIEAVRNYVNDQENHHRIKTFEQEWSWLGEMNAAIQ